MFRLCCVVMFLGVGTIRAEDAPWIDLMKPEVWARFDARWIVTDSVKIDPKNPKKLLAEKTEKGMIWVNGPGNIPNLLTKQKFADCEVELEFMIANGSNAGIKFHGLYEIQILDTYGKDVSKLNGNSMGGIYPRAKGTPPYGYIDDGVPPKVNAANKPGEWNKLSATWKAPKLAEDSDIAEPGYMVRVELNGQLIHENVPIKTPTGANWVRPNSESGPFMLQADHGPTAIRGLKIRPKK